MVLIMYQVGVSGLLVRCVSYVIVNWVELLNIEMVSVQIMVSVLDCMCVGSDLVIVISMVLVDSVEVVVSMVVIRYSIVVLCLCLSSQNVGRIVISSISQGISIIGLWLM